jgi:hypothetical protein
MVATARGERRSRAGEATTSHNLGTAAGGTHTLFVARAGRAKKWRFVRLPGNPKSREPRDRLGRIGTAATQPRRTRFRRGTFPGAAASASFEIPGEGDGGFMGGFGINLMVAVAVGLMVARPLVSWSGVGVKKKDFYPEFTKPSFLELHGNGPQTIYTGGSNKHHESLKRQSNILFIQSKSPFLTILCSITPPAKLSVFLYIFPALKIISLKL